jgi:hypothetical protein
VDFPEAAGPSMAMMDGFGMALFRRLVYGKGWFCESRKRSVRAQSMMGSSP